MSGKARLSVRTQMRSCGLGEEATLQGPRAERKGQRKGSQAEALVGTLLLAPISSVRREHPQCQEDELGGHRHSI